MTKAASSACLKWVAIFAAAATLLASCGKKDDPISEAKKTDAAKGIAAPSIVETKAIAEEGFIYGLPLVMNYAVMYEFAVDTKSRPMLSNMKKNADGSLTF
jgi:hypothetical protein